MSSEPTPGGLDPNELRQSQKMQLLGELAPSIAHELSSPLTAILAFSQLLVGDSRLPDEVQQDARLLVSEADRTQRIIRNLLDFVRNRPAERQLTDVRVLVQAAVDLLASALAEHRIDLDLVIADDVPPVEVDRSAMQQVLLSLISVAMHASSVEPHPDGRGRISVSAAPAPAHRVRISVVDGARRDASSGSRQGEHEPTAARRRTDDIALAVAEALVASHGGRLSIRRHPAGRGSSAVVEIPVTADGWSTPDDTEGTRSAPAIPAPPTTRQPTDRRRPRVLILDDEAPIRGLLRRALQHHGIESTPAADGEEALQVLRDESFDVLLVDHRMPRVDGLEFHRRALEMRPDLAGRFVFMSGDVMDAALQTVAGTSPVRVLGKPFELEAVGRVVAEVIASEGLAPD